jgi:hypothetical protein
MSKSLNILHLFLALNAGACFYFAWQETKDKFVKPERLLGAPVVALIAALILMFIERSAKQPLWPFAPAYAVGLAIGAARGFTMTLTLTSSWRVLRPSGMRDQMWVAMLLTAAIGADMAGAIAGPDGLIWRFPAALMSMACAGALAGRALAMTVRVRRLTG